jgi:RNA polymerase sigma factor (sigma-70 family)
LTDDREIRKDDLGEAAGGRKSDVPTCRVSEWLDSPYLGRVARRVAQTYGVPGQDVPDLLQELRIALWKAGPGSRVSIGWVFQTAKHKTIDWMKRRRRRAEVVLDDGRLPDRLASADPALRCLLHSEASRLPESLRGFYALRYEQGMSQREIARVLGLGRSTVRSLDRQCLGLFGGRVAGRCGIHEVVRSRTPALPSR